MNETEQQLFKVIAEMNFVDDAWDVVKAGLTDPNSSMEEARCQLFQLALTHRRAVVEECQAEIDGLIAIEQNICAWHEMHGHTSHASEAKERLLGLTWAANVLTPLKEPS